MALHYQYHSVVFSFLICSVECPSETKQSQKQYMVSGSLWPRIMLGWPWNQLGGPQRQLGGPQSLLGGPQSQVRGSRGGDAGKDRAEYSWYVVCHRPLRGRCPKVVLVEEEEEEDEEEKQKERHLNRCPLDQAFYTIWHTLAVIRDLISLTQI